MRLPLVFVVAVMPIAPSGLGTTQVASVALLSPFVPVAAGLDPASVQATAAATATILGYSLTVQFGAMLLQAVRGGAMLALWTRRQRKREATATAP